MVTLQLFPYQGVTGTEQPQYTKLYPEATAKMPTEACMQCHPSIATLLRTAGAMHGRVECRQCHLQVHAFIAEETAYEDIRPKCETWR